MIERQDKRYSLNDEMGSPIRLLYRYGNGKAYGYDEFGKDLYESPEEGAGERYSSQGKEQPFGYTGYRYDKISGTYFAQAREYRTELGRFMAEDVIRGNVTVPKTLNRYEYCMSSPIRYVDLNGKDENECSVYYLNNMDGAKVFGHNSILLVDEDGSSEFYSFMGTGAMPDIFNPQFYALGYTGYEELSKEETIKFLETGNVYVTMADKTENFDNYDRALKKDISVEERNKISQRSQYYVSLYNKYKENRILPKDEDALYNLYSHNCDTVAGKILSEIDVEFSICQLGMISSTPNNSFFVRKELLSESWNYVEMGDNSIWEKSISFPGLYYLYYVNQIALDNFISDSFESIFGKDQKEKCGTE